MKPTSFIRRSLVPIPLLAAATLCVLSTSAVARTPADGASSADHSLHQAPAGLPGQHGTFLPHTSRQVAFHDEMRKLWEDHITWTRLAIVTFADGSASFDVTAARLLRNQTDIADAVKPFYGRATGNTLAALLRDHITIAVEILQAAKAGDTAAFDAAKARWYANANDIADFLSSANPRFWPRSVLRAAMEEHLDQTLAEAAHELGGAYEASVADYEAVHRHILDMADLLSSGIMRQFPARFR
jgi:hypothetical protein